MSDLLTRDEYAAIAADMTYRLQPLLTENSVPGMAVKGS